MRVVVPHLLLLLAVFNSANAFHVAPLASTTRSVLRTGLQSTASSSSSSSSLADVQSEMDGKLNLLKSAAETKQEDGDDVVAALIDLEKLSRQAAKFDESYASQMLESLNGSWRLVFTTGTVNTQKKVGKINYFPLKAVQSFDTTNMSIENGIYVGDFSVVKFSGDFSFDPKKRRLEFDFDNVCLFQTFDIKLKKGEAANLGAKSGLGSESNVANAAKNKAAFFNWISADDDIATARGGGGGLALWKRVRE